MRVANKNSEEGKSREYSGRHFLGQVGACSAAVVGAPLAFAATESVCENRSEPVASASHTADELVLIIDPRPSERIEFINPNSPAFTDLEFAGARWAVLPAGPRRSIGKLSALLRMRRLPGGETACSLS